MWKPRQLNTDISLYVAIADELERDILEGHLTAGEKLPPQRALAKVIGVNLTTISRAYKEAEKRGLITGTIGSGTFVSSSGGSSTTLPAMADVSEDLIEMGLVGSLRGHDIDLQPILQSVLANSQLETLLDYCPSQGMAAHREVAAKWVGRYGVQAGPEDMVICTGAMHALNCCLLSLFEPGDRIAVDALTFAGFKAAAHMARIKLEPVQMDEGGMTPESLENICKRGGIKGLYLMPNLQNPTTASLSQDRRQAIAEIIQRYGLILIEDDIYGFAFRESQTAVTALVPDQSVYIGGLSKILFPGLRVAFAAVPARFRPSFIQAVVNSVWMTPPLNAALICECIESGLADQVMMHKQEIIHHRMKLVQKAFKGFNIQWADQGMFLWLHLPEGWNCAEFENAARRSGVSVISAYKFHVGSGQPPNAIRLSVGSVKDDASLERGLEILVSLLKNDQQAVTIM